MSIKFYNINSGEERVAETEPMIAALYNSGDMSPNAHQGQDFGWRLAPEVVVQLKKMRSNERIMRTISERYHLVDGVSDTDILRYISAEAAYKAKQVEEEQDHTDEYNQKIAELSKTKTANKVEETK
jgi:hypothetical protein